MDLLKPNVIKFLIDSYDSVLVKLFNKILKGAGFPKVW